MPTFIDVEIAGLAFQMLSDRGLFWPAQRALFVADTHFGKDATFRHASIGVPAGSTEATLRSIERMMLSSDPASVIVLGDLFHAKSSLSASVCNSLDTFFERHGSIRFTLIRGNHDRRVGSLPSSWPIEVVEPGAQIGEVILAHEPIAVPESARLMLCGHIHPSVHVGSRAERLGKIACFWLSERRLVLPAIGDFTGTHAIRPSANDQIWLALGEQILKYNTGHR